MKVKTTLKPGSHGTRRLLEKYGERLVCVRYRVDERARRRYKTIELIVEEKGVPVVSAKRLGHALIRLSTGEQRRCAEVISRGGVWDPGRQAWRLMWHAVEELGLQRRVIETR